MSILRLWSPAWPCAWAASTAGCTGPAGAFCAPAGSSVPPRIARALAHERVTRVIADLSGTEQCHRYQKNTDTACSKTRDGRTKLARNRRVSKPYLETTSKSLTATPDRVGKSEPYSEGTDARPTEAETATRRPATPPPRTRSPCPPWPPWRRDRPSGG